MATKWAVWLSDEASWAYTGTRRSTGLDEVAANTLARTLSVQERSAYLHVADKGGHYSAAVYRRGKKIT